MDATYIQIAGDQSTDRRRKPLPFIKLYTSLKEEGMRWVRLDLFLRPSLPPVFWLPPVTEYERWRPGRSHHMQWVVPGRQKIDTQWVVSTVLIQTQSVTRRYIDALRMLQLPCSLSTDISKNGPVIMHTLPPCLYLPLPDLTAHDKIKYWRQRRPGEKVTV